MLCSALTPARLCQLCTGFSEASLTSPAGLSRSHTVPARRAPARGPSPAKRSSRAAPRSLARSSELGGRVASSPSALGARPSTTPAAKPKAKSSGPPSDRRRLTLATDGRALKPTLWFPAEDSASTVAERSLGDARKLTAKGLGLPDVEMKLVRCTRFRGAGVLTLCAVRMHSRILGCYQLTDGLGGILFRRCSDAVCRELIGTLGPFPSAVGRYEPLNTYNGGRVLPSGAKLDSIATYLENSSHLEREGLTVCWVTSPAVTSFPKRRGAAKTV